MLMINFEYVITQLIKFDIHDTHLRKSNNSLTLLCDFPGFLYFLSLEFVFEKNQTNSLTLLCDFPGFLHF